MTNAPRTRKQLRLALEDAVNEAHAFRTALTQAGAEFRSEFTPSRPAGLGRHKVEITNLVPEAEILELQAELRLAKARAESLAAAVPTLLHEAGVAARRETLQKVIEALKLTEYGYHEPGDYYYGGYTNAKPGPDRFWSDITTALEVRAEQKRAAEREATEKKVAGLAKGPRTVLGVDPAGGEAVFASILDDGRVQVDRIAEDIKAGERVARLGEELKIDASELAAFTDAVSKLGTATTTKPTKKKSEGKK